MSDEEKQSTETTRPFPFTLASVQLEQVIVTEIRASRSPVPREAHDAHLALANIGCERGNATALVTIQIDEAPDEIFVTLQGAFHYHAEERTDEQVAAFLQNNAVWLLLPFARELVASLSLRMGLAPIVLSTVAIAQEPTEQGISRP